MDQREAHGRQDPQDEDRLPPARAAGEVLVVDPFKEITWGGGNPKLLTARHCFFFEDAGEGKTLVRSVETWEGGAERFLKPIISRAAAAIGKAQLAALKRESER